ncbi:hypothetical protein B0O41_3599 [Propionibacteriaceae bacterium ES.041]|uniref:hypothetical protein n=1 Tax=Enemella evansiae TaxID=2016499 RepID=UPI000B976EE4|nr:hypothetical protein [Enemella evansiae]OYN93975.1 hypothetical protein CGZ96_19010 [Enemella evansiae]OYN97152.1 hypothetical protein CGZ95_15440 [Enemella evansiae]OYO09780.1 hypothetical protein CGZ98_11585 [Enemella evansiae]PFG68752.1 hypothetical protein B0O41_3599 [Propionibacteriaceae bacterium ES.041]
MSDNSRIATLATVLTTGLAGLALTTAVATAAPTQDPGPGSAATAPAPQQQSGRLTPPRDAASPVQITVTGLRPDDRPTASIGEPGAGAGTEASGAVGADGRAVLTVPAPEGGWQQGQEYAAAVTVAEAGDPYWQTTFTFNGNAGDLGRELIAPTRANEPVMVQLTGLKGYAPVVGNVGSWGTEESIDRVGSTADPEGNVTLALAAPPNGWVIGQRYAVYISGGDPADKFWMTQFVYAG